MTADEQLLAAAFLDGERALDAWRAWSAEADIDALDGERVALLPQLYRNITELGADGPLVDRLRSPYRRSWVASQLLLQHAIPAVAALEADGVDVLVVGATGHALSVYPDAGARPFGAVELLVPPADRRRALRTLRRAGWRAIGLLLRRRLRPLVRGRQFLSGPEDALIAISWTSPLVRETAEEPPLDAAVQGVRVRVPGLASQLAEARRAAASRNPPDLRARGDVLAVMRTAGLIPDGDAIDLDHPEVGVDCHREETADRVPARAQRPEDLL